jgi:hypothetical protein
LRKLRRLRQITQRLGDFRAARTYRQADGLLAVLSDRLLRFRNQS